MSSRGSSTYGETILDPSSVTDRELHRMPLKELSRTLSPTVSDSQTMAIYLRWLEVHRDRPSKLSEHWTNTLLHWSQSLRSRGFKEKELIQRVNDWKEKHGPFRSFDRRYPPMPSDIRKAFNEKGLGSPGGERDRFDFNRERELRDLDWELEDMRKENRPSREPIHRKDDDRSGALRTKTNNSNWGPKHEHDEFQQPPANPNYVCNRCGKKGHHLQACPTNMDPSFDVPPGFDYTCKCCYERGKHYRSLCPKNTDPYSIFQRRKALGIYDQSHPSKPRTSTRMRKRNLSNASSEDRKPIKVRKPSGGEELFTRPEAIATGLVEYKGNGENQDDIPSDSPPAPKRSQKNSSHEQPASSDIYSDLENSKDSDDDMPAYVNPKPVKQYCDFVEQLRKRFPAMNEIVNEQQKRPTAIEMAEKDAQRQREEKRARNRSSSPMDYEQSGGTPERTDSQEQASPQSDIHERRSSSGASTYADAPQFPQLDGTFDEEPSGYGKNTPRRNYKIGGFRKITIGKVKETFLSKSSSTSPSAINGAPPMMMKSPSRLSPFLAKKRPTPALSEKSANHRLVPAITSALKLTSRHFESVHEDRRELLQSETSRGSSHSPGPVTTTPTPQKTRNVPNLSPSKSISSVSTDTLGSTEENFGGVPEIKGRIFDHRTYQGLHKRRGASLTPTRSTEGFRHTVRKIIIEGKEAEELKRFSSTFTLVTPVPVRLTKEHRTKSTGAMESAKKLVGYSYTEVVDTDEGQTCTTPRTPIKKEVQVHVTIAKDHYPESTQTSTKKKKAKMLRSLAEWGRSFTLTTPVPEDVAAILNVEGRKQAAMEKAEVEEEKRSLEAFSKNFQPPSSGTTDFVKK